MKISAPEEKTKKKKELVIELLFRGQGDDRGANLHRSAGGTLPADCGTAMAAVVRARRQERRRFRQKMFCHSAWRTLSQHTAASSWLVTHTPSRTDNMPTWISLVSVFVMYESRWYYRLSRRSGLVGYGDYSSLPAQHREPADEVAEDLNLCCLHGETRKLYPV